MKPSCINRVLLLLWLLSVSLWSAAVPKSAVVYYGDEISWPMVGVHDYIIVEPEHIVTDTYGFESYASKVYAYVPLGEVQPSQRYYGDIKKSWVLGKNSMWKSEILDLSNAAYRNFMLEKVIAPLHERGFRNFFFDTLDSYQMVAKEKKAQKKQIDGLASLILEVHRRYPDAKLILNRGFELFEKVKDAVEAVLFESYYHGLAKGMHYKAVSKQEREWLNEKLAPIKASGKPVIALDYLENPHSKEAKRTVEALQTEGFIPYVSTHALDSYGLSAKSAQKREVLFLYSSTEENGKTSSSAHLYGSLPMEYLGYVPVLKDIESFHFTSKAADRYAGVVIWLDKPYQKPGRLFKWVRKMAHKGVYTLFLSSFGLKNRKGGKLSLLDINVASIGSAFKGRARIEVKSSLMDYELPVKIQPHEVMLSPRGAKPLLAYRQSGKRSMLAAITPWGGYAVDEAATVNFAEDTLWSVDPFKLYTKALRLPSVPVPDPTTENGLRILFTHIDGDAVMNKVEFDPSKFSGEVMYERILKKYPIPHTVSFVGGEIMPNGLYPKESPSLLELARKIYALPNVETATHTFSHPFKWEMISSKGDLAPQYRLDIPGYHFNLDYEIAGMLKFADTNLSSSTTKKTQLVLWSGDCLPSEKVLAYVASKHILNMNGGDTTITNDKPWLSKIAPYGIGKGPYYQVYTGAQNENVYTDDFTGPFWGYKKVIQTFKLTESPRRFKPIDIYYHFYAASKMASLRALESVFEWALQQKTVVMYTSEYIPKALSFSTVSMSQGKWGWYVWGVDQLHTLRLPKALGYPDMEQSRGVVGINESRSGRYVILGGEESVRMVLQDSPSGGNYLLWANAKMARRKGDVYAFEGYMPFEGSWHLKKGCSLVPDPAPKVHKQEGDMHTLIYEDAKKVSVHVQCEK